MLADFSRLWAKSQPLVQKRPAWVNIPFCNILCFPEWRGKRVSTVRDPILWFLILPLVDLRDLSKKTLEESPQWRASKAAKKCVPDEPDESQPLQKWTFNCQLQSKYSNSVYHPCRIRPAKSQELPLYIPDLCRTSGSRAQLHQT